METQKRFFILGLVIFTLNVFWEFSHYLLYVDLSGISKYPHLLSASFTDMLIILGIFLLLSLKNGTFSWVKNPRTFDYLFVVFFGLAFAVFIEILNLRLGRWMYTSLMPTFFGIGISPLLQLALTSILSLLLIQVIEK